MTEEQIKSIIAARAYPGASAPADLVETHISWLILAPDFAFKLKKPLSFGFLDFTSLEKRKFYCQEELRLNCRLAPEMYLDVLPVGMVAGQATIGAEPAIDYALQMRRMDNQKQMDKLLEQGQVSRQQLEALAAKLVPFHRAVTLPKNHEFHVGSLWADFADLFRFGPDIARHLGDTASEQLKKWRNSLPEFLETHDQRLQERVRDSFWVDGHGDLHTRNIFLLESGPVVFDCIEFSEHFRHHDILNELAFLCMDLEARDKPDLADAFMQAYCRRWNVMPKQEDQLLFLFFKTYRANVRLKIALLELRQRQTPELLGQARRYWELMEQYVQKLN